jgi:hypothetical protein
MDVTKCRTLQSELSRQLEPRLVSVERFFDGNDDVGSVGWNLTEHPGVDVFRDLLTGLLRRPDVQAVYAQIAELDFEEGHWPSADIFYVVGAISPDEVRKILGPLAPDEVLSVEFAVPEIIKQKHHAPMVAARWS